jgi:hypothetical protein
MATHNHDFMNEPSGENPADRLQQLNHRLNEAGFENIRLKLTDDGELVEFSFHLGVNVKSANRESTYACVLHILRAGGFGIGFEELALTVSRNAINGAFLVRPLAEVCR